MAVECPSDMIDQIGGRAKAGVGQAYGDGHGIDRVGADVGYPVAK